jgi:radical SAM superfamily enzyme YgiQ (UPF0313 family)
MDILLIEPPYKALKGIGSEYGYSVSTVSLAAYLQTNGIRTAVLSGNLKADLPTEESFLFDVRKYAQGQILYEKILDDDTHPIWQNIADTVRTFDPRMVAITCLTPMMDSVRIIARLVKKMDPDIVVVTGGHHPTFCPEDTLQDPHIDIAVRGEGEIPLLMLAKAFAGGIPDREVMAGIPGIHFKYDGKTIGNPDGGMIADLDELPFPARDLVLDCDYERYRLHYVATARGCPYSCTFCSDKALWRNRVRRRSINHVMEEIRHLVTHYDVKYIDIVDGTFTYDRDYVVEFCDRIVRDDMDVRWRCSARYDNLDADLIDKMKQANCKGFYIGLESGSQTILNAVNKKTKIDDIISKSDMIHQSGIMCVTAILLGMPQETRETIEETLGLMQRIQASIFDINCFVPLPGTRFYPPDRPIDWRKVGFKSFENHFTENLSLDELQEYVHKAHEIAWSKRKNFTT